MQRATALLSANPDAHVHLFQSVDTGEVYVVVGLSDLIDDGATERRIEFVPFLVRPVADDEIELYRANPYAWEGNCSEGALSNLSRAIASGAFQAMEQLTVGGWEPWG